MVLKDKLTWKIASLPKNKTVDFGNLKLLEAAFQKSIMVLQETK